MQTDTDAVAAIELLLVSTATPSIVDAWCSRADAGILGCSMSCSRRTCSAVALHVRLQQQRCYTATLAVQMHAT